MLTPRPTLGQERNLANDCSEDPSYCAARAAVHAALHGSWSGAGQGQTRKNLRKFSATACGHLQHRRFLPPLVVTRKWTFANGGNRQP